MHNPVFYTVPASRLRSYFRTTEQPKNSKIIPTALRNAKYSEKKSLQRPPTLAVGVGACFWHRCQNPAPQLLNSFPQQGRHWCCPKLLPSSQKGDENPTALHLGLGLQPAQGVEAEIRVRSCSFYGLCPSCSPRGAGAQREIRRRHGVLWV